MFTLKLFRGFRQSDVSHHPEGGIKASGRLYEVLPWILSKCAHPGGVPTLSDAMTHVIGV